MATGATEFIDHTTADAFIPEIWSREAIIARENALVYAKLVNRGFEDEARFGDTVHVPSVTNLSARTKTLSSNAAITFETQTETNTDITINTWEYAAIAIETALVKQSMQDLVARYTPKMGYALGLAVDDVLAGIPDGFTNAVGTLGVELTYENVVRGRQYLDDANAPMDDRHIVVSPAQEAGFMKLDHFVHNDYSKLQGTKANAKDMAYFGSWLSTPVHKSANVEGTNASGHDNAFFHREAMALVMQMKAKSHHQFDIDYLVDKYVTEHLYGTQTMRNDHGVFMRGA